MDGQLLDQNYQKLEMSGLTRGSVEWQARRGQKPGERERSDCGRRSWAGTVVEH